MTETKTWTEPKSAANEKEKPEYPYNNATVTDSGHSFELDDTPNRERVRLFHRKGTFIEFHPNGDQVVRVVGKDYEITASDKNVSIGGNCNLTIEGDYSLKVKGNYNVEVDGDYTQKISGHVQKLNANSSSRDNSLTEGDLVLGATGKVIINADKFIVNTDMNVGGDISSQQNIKAVGNITAQMSVTGIISVRTPGCLLVGPVASMMPNVPLPGIAQIDRGINVGPGGFINLLGILTVTGSSTVIGPSKVVGTFSTIGMISCTGLIRGNAVVANITPLKGHIHIAPSMGGPTSIAIP